MSFGNCVYCVYLLLIFSYTYLSRCFLDLGSRNGNFIWYLPFLRIILVYVPFTNLLSSELKSFFLGITIYYEYLLNANNYIFRQSCNWLCRVPFRSKTKNKANKNIKMYFYLMTILFNINILIK